MSAQAVSASETEVISEPQRVGVKLFVEDQETFDRARMIEVFHRWIQEDRLPGTLIDVHDYTHVAGGPGVVLIAHEWHLRTDEAGGRIGLEHEVKREESGTLDGRLRDAIASVFEACVALEQDTAGDGVVRFTTREMVFRFTDRLAVPPSEVVFSQITEELERVLTDLYRGARFEFERVGHARGPVTVHVRVVGDGEWTLEELAAGARSATA